MGCFGGGDADEETEFLVVHNQSMFAGTESELCGWMKSVGEEQMVVLGAPLNSAMPYHSKI